MTVFSYIFFKNNKTEEREGTIKWVRSLVKVLHLMMCSSYLHILK